MIKNEFRVLREIENVKIEIQCSYPDDICNEYGADTLRLYEMFLDHLNKRSLGTRQVFLSFGFKSCVVCILMNIR
jgi:hypothetical protein